MTKDFKGLPTALILSQWDQQSTTAERMCADILRLDDFKDVDPQLPRGGPDGGKDILCSKDGLTFVAACYFAHEPTKFAGIKKKFKNDLVASLKHERDGFIFMTNQHLTPVERTELEKCAAKNGKRALIMHREYLRVFLDSPQGYGLRLSHLRIPLSTEEQFAYFASARDDVAEAIAENSRAIDRLSAKLDRSTSAQFGLMMKTTAAVLDAVRGHDEGDVATMLQKSAETAFQALTAPVRGALSGQFSTALICYVHRAVVTSGAHYAGRYRQTQVWLQDATGTINEAFECPSWDKIPVLMEDLVTSWNGGYGALAGATLTKVAESIANFMHRLLSIHPFIDGNGRVSRELASVQARDLLGLSDNLLIDRGERYYRALRLADAKDISELSAIIREAIAGAA